MEPHRRAPLAVDLGNRRKALWRDRTIGVLLTQMREVDPRESLDALLQRYAPGLVGAALGCQVAYESDRAEAVTAVVRAIARERFDARLSPEEVMGRAWPVVLAAQAFVAASKPSSRHIKAFIAVGHVFRRCLPFINSTNDLVQATNRARIQSSSRQASLRSNERTS